MKLTTKSAYGVRALINLAGIETKRPVSLREISMKERISIAFLEQIFNRLRRKGIVRSIRGPKGGYILRRPAEEITVADIIEALGEDTSPVFCVSDYGKKKNKCELEKKCASKYVWERLKNSISIFLNATTLASIADGAKDYKN